MNTTLYRANFGLEPSIRTTIQSKPTDITNHRLEPSDYSVTFTVILSDGKWTTIPERSLQATNPRLVYAYWNSFAGGRCAVTRYDMWHPFNILGHRKSKTGSDILYKVQWVGYNKKEATWETGQHLAAMSGELKQAYDEANHPQQR
ncbi:hypothetical protein FLONG3_3615 [Fusarium longipes]|uniref:Chromo domain-containing protein n=1 Tax=Fusarium longipes TaxID=694270 RepID=A0A395T0U9_9HYPO|nr:hypothetical protein FLONG3_3615 [Fusarium longipes]